MIDFIMFCTKSVLKGIYTKIIFNKQLLNKEKKIKKKYFLFIKRLKYYLLLWHTGIGCFL